MNAEQTVRYLYAHHGQMKVGSPETLAVAQQLREKDFIRQVGVMDGKPVFRVTEAGEFFVAYSMKKLGETPGEKTKSFLRSLGNAMDGYIQAYKTEHPVGMEDLRKTFGWLDSPSMAPVNLPPVAPTSLTEEKKLPKPKKAKEYVIVDGKRYEQV